MKSFFYVTVISIRFQNTNTKTKKKNKKKTNMSTNKSALMPWDKGVYLNKSYMKALQRMLEMDDDCFAEFKDEWGQRGKEMKNNNTLVKEAKQKAKAEKAANIAAKKRERERLAIKKELALQAKRSIRKNKQRERLRSKINKRKGAEPNPVDMLKLEALEREILADDQNKELYSKQIAALDINVQQQGGGGGGGEEEVMDAKRATADNLPLGVGEWQADEI